MKMWPITITLVLNLIFPSLANAPLFIFPVNEPFHFLLSHYILVFLGQCCFSCYIRFLASLEHNFFSKFFFFAYLLLFPSSCTNSSSYTSSFVMHHLLFLLLFPHHGPPFPFSSSSFVISPHFFFLSSS